jgi:hypothetical protein
MPFEDLLVTARHYKAVDLGTLSHKVQDMSGRVALVSGTGSSFVKICCVHFFDNREDRQTGHTRDTRTRLALQQ